MSHLLKFTEWQSGDKWHTGDTSDLAHGSNYWWNVPRMLEMELSDYVLFLKNKFNATNFYYNPKYNVLLWDWNSYSDCHRFTLYVNGVSRKKQFFV